MNHLHQQLDMYNLDIPKPRIGSLHIYQSWLHQSGRIAH